MYLCWENRQDMDFRIKLPKIATAQVVSLLVGIGADKKDSEDGIVIWLKVRKESICS